MNIIYLHQSLEIMNFIFHQSRHTDLLSSILTYMQSTPGHMLLSSSHKLFMINTTIPYIPAYKAIHI